MKNTILVAFLALNIAACNYSKPEQDLSIVPSAKAASPNNSLSAATISNNNLPPQILSNKTTVLPQNATSVPQKVVATTAAGMNPPHGQPGHRCDINVGAPLNSAPTRVPTQPITTTSQIVPSAKTVSIPTPVNNLVTAKGMNPPHGQPGHRCDISVGAPLNSKPTKTTPSLNKGTANITQMPSPISNGAIVPALQNTNITPALGSKAVTAFTGKINPAHGQPGHDCKVAVGQPLP